MKKILSFLLTSIIITSCNTINNLDTQNQVLINNNHELRVDDGTITKNVKININSGFKIKDVSSGETEKTLSDVQSIKLIISKNTYAPFNEVTKDLVITSISSIINFTLNGLKANTNYYIAVRAYSTTTPSESANITEGGTIVSSEYININNTGNLSIVNDNSNNIIDLNLKLNNRVGVKVDSFTKIKDGNLDDFAFDIPLLASNYVNYPDTANKPKVFINNKGNGLILWYKNQGSGSNYYVEGVKIKDYEVNGDPISFSALTNLNINDLSFETDENGNGVLIFSRKLNAVNPEHIFYNEINNNESIMLDNQLDTNSNPEYQVSPVSKLSHTNNKVLAAWITRDLSIDKEELCLRASGFPSISFGSQFNTNVHPNKIIFFDTSKPNNNGDFLAVLVEADNDYKVKIVKFNINTSNNINFINEIDITPEDSVPKEDSKIHLNNNGDGIVFWIQHEGIFKKLYYKNIFNFYPSNETIELHSTTDLIKSLSLSLNQNGNGILSWIENDKIIISPINKFNPSYAQEVLSGVTSINVYLNSLSQGILTLQNNVDNKIYYHRIFNKIAQ